MEKAINELKSLITKLNLEVSKIKADQMEDRLFFKALNGTVDNLSAQIGNLGEQIEISHKKAEVQAKEQQTTNAAMEMNLTEIAKLYKKDPVAGRKALEAHGMTPDIGSNPWIYTDKTAQQRIREADPELAKKLEADAAAQYVASLK